MPELDQLLNEYSIQSVRSDGSQMIVLKINCDETNAAWEILFVHKDGHVDNDGITELPKGGKFIWRKISNDEQLRETAIQYDFVEWRSCVLEERPDERILQLQDQLGQMAHQLQEDKIHQEKMDQQLEEAKTDYEAVDQQLKDAKAKIQALTAENTSQKRKQRTTQREAEEIIHTTAAAIAARTPNETQKIIANQVDLGAGFYQQVGSQSHESFRLSLWLAGAGAIIFLLTVIASIWIVSSRGDSTLMTIIGTLAAAITEGLAASNRLYNQASEQFANFQIDLDRINRSSIGYAMVTEDNFEKKTSTQQEAIIKIVDELLQKH